MDDKYLEHFAMMVEELRGIKTELKTLNNSVDGLNNRVEKLEEQQSKTNTLLSQHTRDLMKIIEMLEADVPHFDKVVNMEIIKGTSKKQTVILRRG